MRTVLILSFSKLQRDGRVLRQIEALENSYRVVTCGYGPAPAGSQRHWEIPEEAKWRPVGILGLSALAVRAHKFAYSQIPAAREAHRMLKSANFDVLLANDVDTVPVGLRLAGDRPVVVDLGEFAPDQFVDWRWRLLMRPLVVKICREQIPQASAVSTEGPLSGDEYRRRFGFESQPVTNAGNYRSPKPRAVGRPIRIVHPGAAIRHRVLERMIEGLGGLPNVSLDMFLVPQPHNAKYLEELRSLAEQYSNVNIKSPVPMEQLPEVLDEYDLGIFVLPPTCLNYYYALPNKFFEFVQSGLPMIIGPSPEMAALVEKYKLGLVLPDWKVGTLREAAQRITPDEVAAWQVNVCEAAARLDDTQSRETISTMVAKAWRDSISKSTGVARG